MTIHFRPKRAGALVGRHVVSGDEDQRHRDRPHRGAARTCSGSRCTLTRASPASAKPSTCRARSRNTSMNMSRRVSSAAIRLQIDLLSADLVGYLGFRSSGAEVRGNSAFDIALWDIFGKATGQPVAQLLGGFSPAVDPHLQYLRRHRVHQGRQGPDHRQLRARRRSRATTISTASCIAPANWPKSCSTTASRP